MLLCLSRQCTLTYLDHIGKTIDNEVIERKNSVVETIIISEVHHLRYVTSLFSVDLYFIGLGGSTAITPTF